MMNPQARLGAFVLATLLLFIFATGRIGDISWNSAQDHFVEAEFSDLMGLDVQSPVRMAGVKVGIVSEIRLKDNHAVVRIGLDPEVKLPASTRASIVSRGLVGEKNLALYANDGDNNWLPDGAIIPTDSSGDLNSLINKATDITEGLGALTGDDKGSIQQLVSNTNQTVLELDEMLKENRTQLLAITTTMQTLVDKLEHTLPRAVQSGDRFFRESTKTSKLLNKTMLDNRENLYRTIFELRTASENLAAFSEDIRLNPWKLMKEKREIKPDKRARQEKMEEMLMTTGVMGIAPARE